MRHTILVAMLLSSCATGVAAEPPRLARQSFTVVVPPKLEAEQSAGHIRFRSSVPLLIQAMDSASDRVLWTRALPAEASRTVAIEAIESTEQPSVMMLTIVPLY